MTTSTLTASTPVHQSAPWRWAAVAIAAAGPLAIAVLRWLLPYDTTDDTAAVVDKIGTNPAAGSAVLWLTYLAVLTLPIGVLIAGRLAMRTRPVLGTIATVVAWLGFTSLFASVVVSDYVGLAGATNGTPNSTTAALLDSIAAHPATSTAATVFVAGHILGAVLLAIALWRVIPTWAAAALAVSQPLHFVFAVVVPNHALDAGAWALTGVGFAAAALAHTRAE